MTLFEHLQSHKGSLLRLKTELFWYGRGWDKNPGQICLILDACTATTADAAIDFDASAGALLLIDGSPQWIWAAESNVEVIDESV
jgi:hypothetical protein